MNDHGYNYGDQYYYTSTRNTTTTTAAAAAADTTTTTTATTTTSTITTTTTATTTNAKLLMPQALAKSAGFGDKPHTRRFSLGHLGFQATAVLQPRQLIIGTQTSQKACNEMQETVAARAFSGSL